MKSIYDSRIKELFKEMDSIDVRTETDYGRKYWDVKLSLIHEITKKYGSELGIDYSPNELKTLHVPAGLCSIIVKMEREHLSGEAWKLNLNITS
jgi:hypothetical protein